MLTSSMHRLSFIHTTVDTDKKCNNAWHAVQSVQAERINKNKLYWYLDWCVIKTIDWLLLFDFF